MKAKRIVFTKEVWIYHFSEDLLPSYKIYGDGSKGQPDPNNEPTGDEQAYDQAMADFKADNYQTISHDVIKMRYGVK